MSSCTIRPIYFQIHYWQLECCSHVQSFVSNFSRSHNLVIECVSSLDCSLQSRKTGGGNVRQFSSVTAMSRYCRSAEEVKNDEGSVLKCVVVGLLLAFTADWTEPVRSFLTVPLSLGKSDDDWRTSETIVDLSFLLIRLCRHLRVEYNVELSVEHWTTTHLHSLAYTAHRRRRRGTWGHLPSPKFGKIFFGQHHVRFGHLVTF